jgi:hypothetical protein
MILCLQTRALLERFCWNCSQSHVALQYLQVFRFFYVIAVTVSDALFCSIMSVVSTPAVTL